MRPLWSGHSRWLLPCSRYVCCLTRACFSSTCSHGWPSQDVPQTPARGGTQRGSEGCAPVLVGLVTNEPTCCNLPITGHAPLPEWKLPPCPARHQPHTVGCRSRTCPRRVSTPIHGATAVSLLTLAGPSVSKQDRHGPRRPMGACSPPGPKATRPLCQRSPARTSHSFTDALNIRPASVYWRPGAGAVGEEATDRFPASAARTV